MDIRIDKPGRVKIMVFNMVGEEVKVLLDQDMVMGNSRVYWDGRNRKGEILGNAVYLVAIETPLGQMIRKVIILK